METGRKDKRTFQIEGMTQAKSPEVGESKVNWRDSKKADQCGTSAWGGGVQWGWRGRQGQLDYLGVLRMLILIIRVWSTLK